VARRSVPVRSCHCRRPPPRSRLSTGSSASALAPPGRITVLWAEHNQRPPDVFYTRRGWAELASGGFDVRPIPGSHLTVFVEPLVAITAATLADALRETRPGGEGRAMPERHNAPGEVPAAGARR
jgi:hypothetical protein